MGGMLALDKHVGPKVLNLMYLVGINKTRQMNGKPPLKELPETMIPGELPQEIKDDLGEPLTQEELDSLFMPSDDFRAEGGR